MSYWHSTIPSRRFFFLYYCISNGWYTCRRGKVRLLFVTTNIALTCRSTLLQLNELCVHFHIFGRPEIIIFCVYHADDLLHEFHHSNMEFNENSMLERVVNECYHKNQKVKQKYVPYIIACILFECSVTNVFLEMYSVGGKSS